MLSVHVHLPSGKTCSVRLPAESRIRELKAEVQRQFKSPFLKLAFRGEPLEVSSTLSERVQDGDSVDAVLLPVKLASTTAQVTLAVAAWPPELVSSGAVSQSFLDAVDEALRKALSLRLALPAGARAPGGKLASGSPSLKNRPPDGCVGHFAAQHLVQQPNLSWAIAGRNASQLEALKASLHGVSMPQVLAKALDQDVKTWLGSTRAVISAAGPFSIHQGEALLSAAAELGIHYADTSDEFYWQREMIDKYDEVAIKSGAKVVLSSGFCALAADLGASLALENFSGELQLDAWLERYNGGVSAGVLNTAKVLKNASFPKAWEKDPYVLAPGAKSTLRKDTQVEGMGFPSWVASEGPIVSNLFGPYDARLLRRSLKLRVGASAGMYPKWAAFLAEHPGSWSTLSKCPTQAIYDGGSWSYRFKARSGASGDSEVLLSGAGDPGYRFTAVGLAEAGLCLAGKTGSCARTGAGIMTPMGAANVKVLADRLKSIGVLDIQTTRLESIPADSLPELVV
ncbi:unnamed protein product [Effrenium voratum]|nr:unnamed protein product [Effrenium voratum]